jgi:co-chaperonin GroES (HSP10)
MQTAEQQSEIQPIAIRPEWDRVIVELVDVEEKESALHLDAMEKPHEYGRITALGPEVIPERFQVGEIVVFGQYSGYAIAQEQTIILRATDIIGHVSGGRVVPKRKSRAESEIAVVQGDPAALNGKFGKGPRG